MQNWQLLWQLIYSSSDFDMKGYYDKKLPVIFVFLDKSLGYDDACSLILIQQL